MRYSILKNKVSYDTLLATAKCIAILCFRFLLETLIPMLRLLKLVRSISPRAASRAGYAASAISPFEQQHLGVPVDDDNRHKKTSDASKSMTIAVGMICI